MPNRPQIVCVLNPDQFNWKGVIKDYYLSGLLDIEPIDGNLGLVDSIFPTITDEDLHQDISILKALDFTCHEDQITFNTIIQDHLGALTFLLQNGKLYEFHELLQMGKKSIERVTGGGKGVILVDPRFIEDLPLSPLDSLKTH